MRTIDGQVFVRTKGAETIKLSLVDVLLFDEKAITQNLERKRDAAKPIYESLQPILKVAVSREADAKEAMRRAFNAMSKTDGVLSTAAMIPFVKEGTELWRTLDKIIEGGKETTLKSTDMDQIRMAVDEAQKRTSEAFREASVALSDIIGKVGYTSSALYYFSDLPEAMQATKTDADGKFSFKVPTGSYALAAASSRQAGKETEFYHWMVKVTVANDKKAMLANDNLSTSGSPDSMISTTEIGTWATHAVAEGVSLASLEAFIERKKAEQLAEARVKKELQEKKLAEEREQRELREKELAGYRQNPKAAQQKAVALYPDIGVAGSPLNKEFLARVKRYQAEKKEFFWAPDWPIRLGKECSEELSAKQPAK